MYELNILANSIPGTVTFENYDEIKTQLSQFINEEFGEVDYSSSGISVAETDLEKLKTIKKAITDKQKELKAYYTAPYEEVEKKLNELVNVINPYYKVAKAFVDENEKDIKKSQIMEYAKTKALSYGEYGNKIIDSPAFFRNEWLLKKYSVKNYQDEIDAIISRSISDIKNIQNSGDSNEVTLLARYFESLSIEDVKRFQSSLQEDLGNIDCISVESENNVVGYKILKITATEDEMANLLDQMELMGIEVEEIEDGMPKPMEELTEPDFDSFVAFDIETTGTNGAANGDSEAQITEIGAVKVENGEIVERFDQLANPGRPIVPRISRITHITDDMVADMPPVDEVIKMFNEFVGDNILVGHNIKSSDLRYITKAANKAGVNIKGPFFDTYLYAKKIKDINNWEKVNLPYLANYYGFEHVEAHRAWCDAEVNAKVYFEFQRIK